MSNRLQKNKRVGGPLSPLSPFELTQSLKSEAVRLGFSLTGACPAVTPTGFHAFSQWVDAGYAGEMDYLASRRSAYQHPQHVMEGVTSLLMLGMNYQTVPPAPGEPGRGRIARYAWGAADYHDHVHRQLKELKRFALGLGDQIRVRGVVDTAPLLEREFAQLAGIGWVGKNSMLINREHGSWFLIAALLINCELDYDAPFEANHCGTCTACLDACPTDAFLGPGRLDATRCISYLTIEHRSPVPQGLREGIGDRLLGCDVCQEVCPWNRKSSRTELEMFQPLPDQNPIDVRRLFWLDDDAFRARFRKTPLWRPKRRGILRNAAIVLGNEPHPENLPALSRGLHDDESLVRGAAAWALGRHDPSVVRPLLEERLKSEPDAEVVCEIEAAIDWSNG